MVSRSRPAYISITCKKKVPTEIMPGIYVLAADDPEVIPGIDLLKPGVPDIIPVI